MTPDDPRHGTYPGVSAHYRAGEALCEACEVAARRYRKRLRHDLHKGRGRLVPALGFRRRCQALRAIGWTIRAIAAELGMNESTLETMLARGDKITRRHHESMIKVYDRLSMSIPQGVAAHRARLTAARRGWPPPLAWDDDKIDNPDAEPRGQAFRRDPGIDWAVIERALQGEPVAANREERLLIAERWPETGRSLSELERIQGWNVHRDRRAA